MFKFKILVFLVISILFSSCSKEVSKKSIIKEKSLESQVQEAYNEGMEALESGDVLFAAKKFNEAEILFPQANSAPQSALMAAYSYYTQDYYSDAKTELSLTDQIWCGDLAGRFNKKPGAAANDFVYDNFQLEYFTHIQLLE